ncbi:MAG: hypothetical protein ABI183_20090 [Polyangiaceae bacterium]
MNYWKPIALTLAVGLVASIGMQTASAKNADSSQPTLTGECHDQPNMAKATHDLTAALDSLGKAEHNKGGWRDRATTAATTALHETQAGCAVANVH